MLHEVVLFKRWHNWYHARAGENEVLVRTGGLEGGCTFISESYYGERRGGVPPIMSDNYISEVCELHWCAIADTILNSVRGFLIKLMFSTSSHRSYDRFWNQFFRYHLW